MPTRANHKKSHQDIDLMQARLPKGTFKRMDRVLKGGEIRSAFLRAAVENELRRREGVAKKREPLDPVRDLAAAE